MRTATVYFLSLDRLLLLYMSQVRTKLEYDPVIPNSHPDTDCSKLERVQESFVPYVTIESLKNHSSRSYNHVLDNLKSHTLFMRRHYFEEFL
jgi:hypothetical protein